jgi:hypothetical protein
LLHIRIVYIWFGHVPGIASHPPCVGLVWS